ncbi:rab-GTPase-TBC domain-domain-containing protein [Absidia repens]|uniref:Rab-GTPase-TBC domain-domain-containing protein n=1 Tax=Absidia repens TaxID=90262 RepID=A0A1X2J321_9FUNG|nr:rab-GTPase-TBC domain-domain-containing protein [Absidia repens]
MNSSFKERLKYFETTLRDQNDDDDQDPSEHWTPLIDMNTFRDMCFQGIPEESGLRATAWKLLLGYLPPNKTMWQSIIHDQRLSYYNLVKDFLEKPRGRPPEGDHPLNASPESDWATYIQDNSTLEQIDKDVRRTLPDFAFFQQRVPQNPLNPLSAQPEPTSMPSPHCSNIDETEPDMDPLRQNDTKRRFSFGIMGRPRSGSNTSKKSLKINSTIGVNSSNTTPPNPTATTTTANRSRSNSRSSARSFSSGMMENGADIIHSPRNLVRKLSTAFHKSGSSLSLSTTAAAIKQKKHWPIAELHPICPYIPNRRSLFKRIQLEKDTTTTTTTSNPSNSNHQTLDSDDSTPDYHWEVIERILFMYAKLNPGIGYVQGMNELVAPIYYVFANDTSPTLAGQVHAEADTFFVFTILMSDVRDHFVRSLDQDASTGIHGTLFRLQQRLAWYDRALWRDLQRKNVKEPYYAFRWITVLFTQEWNLPDVIRLWDSLLAERGMQSIHGGSGGTTDTHFEFLLDFSVAMLVCVRQELLKGDFAENIKLLQDYPINDIQYVLTMAYRIRETRLQMVTCGQIVPGVNDVRHSGLFSSDWSDTSSISSTTSTASSRLQQRLRESTDLARSSFDSFRRESRESMDDMFRRGMAASSEQWKRTSSSDMRRSISQRVGFVKNSVFNKAKRSGSVRSTASDTSSPSFLQSISSSQQHWLLANQFNTNQLDLPSNMSMDHPSQPQRHLRSNSTNTHNTGFLPDDGHHERHQRTTSASSHPSSSSTVDGSLLSRSSNFVNRFSQMVVAADHSGTMPGGDHRYQQSPPMRSDPLTQRPMVNGGGDSNDSSSSTRLLRTSSPSNETNNFMTTNDDENEKSLFAKAAAARDEALHYRTSTTYKGCV